MNFNDNYPPGVSDNTPNAPWNRYEPQEVDVDICVSTCLSKNAVIFTDNYTEIQECDADIDDEGNSYCHVWTEKVFDDSALKEDYESQEITVEKLLKQVCNYAELKKKQYYKGMDNARKKGDKIAVAKFRQAYVKWSEIYESSKGWEQDELSVYKN